MPQGTSVHDASGGGLSKNLPVARNARAQTAITRLGLGLPGLPASPKPGLNRAGLVDIVFFDEKRVHDVVWVSMLVCCATNKMRRF
jgi:hypothetical protein